MKNQKTKGVNKGLLTMIVILIVIFLLAMLGLVFYLVKAGQPFSHTSKDKVAFDKIYKEGAKTKSAGSIKAGANPEYQKMIGKWDTGCLVPDSKSPWAEKHEFIFNGDATAQHFRWSGDSCATLTKDAFTQRYRVEISGLGKVDLIAIDDGQNIYDIYKIEGNSLYLGHGFRTNYPAGMENFGQTPEARFNSLNTFLKYNKLSN